MKKILFLVLFLSFFEITLSQSHIPSECEVESNLFEDNVNNHNYLLSSWNNVKRIKIAVLLVDFPDGRVNGVDQPFYTNQLGQINDTDAAAEVGLKIVGTDTVPECSKYTYFDRWNMYFDSLGNYFGGNHPDHGVTRDSAWGSFKEYWKEVTNNTISMDPALIRPQATGDVRFKTGLINNYVEINGRIIINSVRLPKNKYKRSGNPYGYFNGYPFTTQQGGAYIDIGNDAYHILDSLRIAHPDQYPFDHRGFIASGGKIIVMFAGGGTGIAGATSGDKIVVRGRGYPLVNMNYPLEPYDNMLRSSRLDGIGISCHEIGHNIFGWSHVDASRYDIMNGSVFSLNCPPHPNPIYKAQQGWIQPIAIDNNGNVNNIEAIETSNSCGVVTIFGKPSASQNWRTGEAYFIENRRMLNFDRKIIDSSYFRLHPEHSEFTGGMLIWHYSPYFLFNYNGLNQRDRTIKLITPNQDSTLGEISKGDPTHFFGFLPEQLAKYYKLDSNRTYSGGNFRTGIILQNISQANDEFSVTMNYTISEPPEYDEVIFFRDYNRHKLNLSGKIYYHEYDSAGFFAIAPGTIIETHVLHPKFRTGKLPF